MKRPAALLLAVAVAAGCKATAAAYMGYTPLMTAAYTDRVSDIERLVRGGANVNERWGHTPDGVGKTALMAAAAGNAVAAARTLIKLGADVNALDTSNVLEATALMIAARHNHVDVMKVLIENGADVQLSVDSNYTALQRAQRNNQHEAAELLIDNGALAGDTLVGFGAMPRLTRHIADTAERAATLARAKLQKQLLDAIKANDSAEAARVLDAGANANGGREHQMMSYRRPLTAAAQRDAPAIARLLIARGAQVDAEDSMQSLRWTALITAANGGKPAVMRALLDKGANPNHQVTGFGFTSLMAAAQIGNADGVQLLLDRGADPRAFNSQGQEAAYFASGFAGRPLARAGDDRALKLLLAAGGSITPRPPVATPPTAVQMRASAEMMWRVGLRIFVRLDTTTWADSVIVTSGDKPTPVRLGPMSAGAGLPWVTSASLEFRRDGRTRCRRRLEFTRVDSTNATMRVDGGTAQPFRMPYTPAVGC